MVPDLGSIPVSGVLFGDFFFLKTKGLISQAKSHKQNECGRAKLALFTKLSQSFLHFLSIYSYTLVHISSHFPLYSKKKWIRNRVLYFLTTQRYTVPYSFITQQDEYF